MISRFEVPIKFWLIIIIQTTWFLQSFCGIRIFLSRSFFSLGGCFVTGCQLRIICSVVELLILRLDCVLVVVGHSNRPHIYFYIVIFLGKSGILFHRWLGVCSALPSVPEDYLNQFGFIGGMCSTRR